MFEGPRKPALTEAQRTLARKRQEAHARTGTAASAGLSAGMAREIAQAVAILEREIAELEQA